MTHDRSDLTKIASTGPMPGVCDFCSTPLADLPTVWCYATKPEQVMATEVIGGLPVDHVDADGQWAACPTCHDLIESDDYEGLANRSVEAGPFEPELKPVIKLVILGMHREFKTHRSGPAWIDSRRISTGQTLYMEVPRDKS